MSSFVAASKMSLCECFVTLDTFGGKLLFFDDFEEVMAFWTFLWILMGELCFWAKKWPI